MRRASLFYLLPACCLGLLFAVVMVSAQSVSAPKPVAQGKEVEPQISSGGKAPKTVGPPPADVPQAFAVAYMVEAALETCRAGDAIKAADCARKKCAAASAPQGGTAADCLIIAACDPSGWSGVMGVALGEAHFSTAMCGAPSRNALLAALKEYCKGFLPHLRECNVGTLYGPRGEEEEVGEKYHWYRRDFGAKPLD
jgi:hypothetical protein